jgi:hypothetical protein
MLKNRNMFLLIGIIFILFTCSSVFGGQNVSIPLSVHEALREGISGIDRTEEPVTIGIPFPKGMLYEKNGIPRLSLEGAQEFQFRVLRNWSDGSIKWLLAEFLATLKKDKSTEVIIKDGTGLSSSNLLATDKGKSIWVDTGALKVEIKKERFNIFNKVMLNGEEIVQGGSSRGIVLIDGEEKEFLASQCNDTKVTIEENGPVQATIRADGSLCRDKNKLLDYTMRFFFFKGKSRVKAQFSLRNASQKSVQHAFIKSLNLDVQVNLTGEKKILVSTHKGPQDLELQKGTLKYYQAVSDFPWMSDGDSFYYQGPIPPDYSREEQRGYKQEGYWIWVNEKLILSGKRNEYPDVGFIDISDQKGRGLTAGIRYMAGNWPKALKADASGKIIVSLWPEENQAGYWIRYGSHNSFEVIYNFHSDKTINPADEMKRVQYPLVAKAPIEWYNNNADGIHPLYRFISFSDEKKLAQKLGIEYKVGWRKPKFEVWRYHYWGHGAFLNQHDFARIALVNFLRDDRALIKAGESYLRAESMFNYYADWAVYHSDDYDYSKKEFLPKENNDKAGLAKVIFEWEHQHWYGMPLYYYMTGDERIKEAILDLGDYIKKLSNPLNMTHMRVFGTGMFSLAAMYEFTGDKEFLRLADMNFKRLLDAKYNPQQPNSTIFIDWERGCVMGGSGSGWSPENPGVKADLMLGSLLYDGLLNYYFFMEKDNPLKDKLYALIMKISEFMYKEPYFEGTKRGHWAYWIPYTYNLGDREKSQHGYKLIGQASFWVVAPYLFTQEKRWLERMEKMLKMALWDESGLWGSFGYMDHPGFQTMAYLLLKGN